MLAVGGRRAPHRARQVRGGCECRLSGVDPAGQPRRDLLQQPAVAVRVAERGEGAVAGVIGRGPADATARAVGLELSARRPGVEHLADLDTAGDELVARSLDVGDDQVEALGRAGRGRRDVRAELNRAPRAGRRELDDPEAVIEGEVGVEPPAQRLIEALGAIDVGDGQHHNFKFHVHDSTPLLVSLSQPVWPSPCTASDHSVATVEGSAITRQDAHGDEMQCLDGLPKPE